MLCSGNIIFYVHNLANLVRMCTGLQFTLGIHDKGIFPIQTFKYIYDIIIRQLENKHRNSCILEPFSTRQSI